jgi:ABC-type glycerol-3-phosphate transport system permease component
MRKSRPDRTSFPIPHSSFLISRALISLLLLLAAAVALTPLLWLVAASTKGPDDLFHYTFFSPRVSAQNFTDLFNQVPFKRYMINSVFVACATVMVQLFFSSLAGFALAKYEFKGKKAIMLLMLATLMIPAQVVIAPLYELVYRLGLVDSYAGLIIPGAVSVFGIFLFRQAILQVPDELLHAARIDGCSEFRIYWDVVMPISRPMVGAFCLISFMAAWNSFLWPQIILHNSDHFTLPIAMNQMIGLYQQSYGLLMAGTLLCILPVIVLFLLLQREFVAGLTAGAVKG